MKRLILQHRMPKTAPTTFSSLSSFLSVQSAADPTAAWLKGNSSSLDAGVVAASCVSSATPTVASTFQSFFCPSLPAKRGRAGPKRCSQQPSGRVTLAQEKNCRVSRIFMEAAKNPSVSSMFWALMCFHHLFPSLCFELCPFLQKQA